MQVGFLGLGRMGSAMARNIAKAGHPVHAWTRSGQTADGVQQAGTPADVFQADAVFTMLSDDAAIREVVLAGGVLGQARRGVVHVVTSTISVAFADELAAAHAAAGLAYVSAPVFGRPDVAEAGQLNVVAAGVKEHIATVQPLLDAIGRRTWVMGQTPSQANAAKIAGNMMLAMAIEAMAEAVVLTKGNGVEPAALFDLLTNTLFGGRAYETYSANIAGERYEPGFLMKLGLKDLKLATAVAESAGRRLPMLQALQLQMQNAIDAGMGERDWSAVADYTINKTGESRVPDHPAPDGE